MLLLVMREKEERSKLKRFFVEDGRFMLVLEKKRKDLKRKGFREREKIFEKVERFLFVSEIKREDIWGR